MRFLWLGFGLLLCATNVMVRTSPQASQVAAQSSGPRTSSLLAFDAESAPAASRPTNRWQALGEGLGGVTGLVQGACCLLVGWGLSRSPRPWVIPAFSVAMVASGAQEAALGLALHTVPGMLLGLLAMSAGIAALAGHGFARFAGLVYASMRLVQSLMGLASLALPDSPLLAFATVATLLLWPAAVLTFFAQAWVRDRLQMG